MRAALLILIGIMLSGCVFVHIQKPPQGISFRNIVKPADVAAVYSNAGSKDGSGQALSRVLFPDSPYCDPEYPDRIRLQSRSDEVIRCEAICTGKVVRTRDLVRNEDFRISDGVIHLISRKKDLLATDIEVGVVGIEKKSETLRLTESGDILTTQRASSATMVLFVIPAGGVDSSFNVFKRISER